MSTLSLVSKTHKDLLTRIQLLEQATLSLLEKKVSHEKGKEHVEDCEGLVEDFLEFFRVGLMIHFKIEEIALFPILIRTVKEAEPLISELISEHSGMIDKYFKLQDSRPTNINDLTTLLKELSEHAKKEEYSLPRHIAFLNEEQLRKIDKITRRFGYLA